jgi:hypothetical protein
MENHVKRFIHATNPTMANVLINVSKMEMMPNVVVMKDVK